MIDMMKNELKIGVSVLEPVLAWIGLVASACLGAVWIAQAVMAGNHLGVVVRFTVSVVCGLYYLLLVELSRRR